MDPQPTTAMPLPAPEPPPFCPRDPKGPPEGPMPQFPTDPPPV